MLQFESDKDIIKVRIDYYAKYVDDNWYIDLDWKAQTNLQRA